MNYFLSWDIARICLWTQAAESPYTHTTTIYSTQRLD